MPRRFTPRLVRRALFALLAIGAGQVSALATEVSRGSPAACEARMCRVDAKGQCCCTAGRRGRTHAEHAGQAHGQDAEHAAHGQDAGHEHGRDAEHEHGTTLDSSHRAQHAHGHDHGDHGAVAATGTTRHVKLPLIGPRMQPPCPDVCATASPLDPRNGTLSAATARLVRAAAVRQLRTVESRLRGTDTRNVAQPRAPPVLVR